MSPSDTHVFRERLARVEPARRTGKVRRIGVDRIEANGPLTCVGDICAIEGGALAEVAAVEPGRVVLVPFKEGEPVRPGAIITAMPSQSHAPVGDAFAGRAIDAMAAPIDGGAPILAGARGPLQGAVLAPLERADADAPLETGIRAIDGVLTLSRGQRTGIFSASGVGKTTLITQLATQVAADRCVVCLVGERGREVESIWRTLGQTQGANRYTCVAATSDQSAPLRARALFQALALCEYWRDQGEHVLLIVDSITRFAMALREIGLAAGAPPTLRAYTPNVFAALPRIVERCGAARAGGAITAMITVLSETDDVDDPIVEVMKALLDGHIVLSRQLAEQGRFPAIDIQRSVSRQSEKLMKPAHAGAARQAIASLSLYEDARVMIESGLYKPGANAKLDEAVAQREALITFLRQGTGERTSLNDTISRLQAAISHGGRHA